MSEDEIIEITINPSDERQGNRGRMRMIEHSSIGFTYSGHPTDQVKSALQKYIRLNMPVKAIQAATELYRMIEIDGGLPLQSNMYNRIAVISAEDVGIGHFPLVISSINYILELKKDRTKRNPVELMALVQALAGAEKSRIADHFYRTYALPVGQRIGYEHGLITVDQLEDIQVLPDGFWRADDPLEIRGICEMFAYRLQQRNPLALYWLGLFLKNYEKTKVSRRRRRSVGIILIWEIIRLSRVTTITTEGNNGGYQEEVYETCERAYFEFSEKGPFLTLIISAILMNVPYHPQPLQPYFEAWSTKQELVEMFFNPPANYSFELDSFVIDMHTRAGRSQGKGLEEFADVGSRVSPVSVPFTIPLLEEIYKLTLKS